MQPLLLGRRLTLASPIAAAAISLACAGSVPKPASPVRPAPPAESPAAEPEPLAQLPPLTSRERELAAQLQRDVRELSTEIGERSSQQLWNQASAADFIALQLEAAGYTVNRQGFGLGPDAVAQNLEVQVPGGVRGAEIVLVGAHYDSAIGSPGADDNASGVAALLALARMLSGTHPSRTIRLVALAAHAPPYRMTPQMGGTIYAKAAAARGDRVYAMLSLESLGYFSDEANSQQRPGALASRFPARGDFIAVAGDQRCGDLADRVLAIMRRSGRIPAAGGQLPEAEAELGGSGHRAFSALGFPAVIITDTGPLRNPHHGQATDTPERLDFDRMARVVARLEQVVLQLAATDERSEPERA
jgi:hypothetical protein